MSIEAKNLGGGYTGKRVVKKINLALQDGEWLSLIGANGSGKSTLLKLMSRLLLPQEGTVLLDGVEIHNLPASLVAQKLALLPQQQTIPSGLTVWQLVALGRTPHQPWWQWQLNSEDRTKVDKALLLTRMEGFSERPVEQLSGGEKQRAFLALALAQNPQILLLDEPTTYLDVRYQLELLELLKRLNQEQGLTIITVLHDVNLAARYSSRIALLSQGIVFDLGTPELVLTPANLADVLGIEAAILQTPVGLQICPLSSCI
ncbi:MAG: ABC transporter ATP-binding protein [Cyanomargarita calcarea GSE-NOS-MK-12-04C]|jgi:iron complex transport system ATP-binding protein|uniref:ABC transporter ATP-binding protein n=1 Tax=Cyanomargarita calcarea GSE-NOS-MK-12-04C TaxID=2839659 RepID=A0A951QLF3_9CYAN|nr:ABC transporter ATP-binding protein [Cyanomargarita calcarea GSE-NOS-MK-12-04C]